MNFISKNRSNEESFNIKISKAVTTYDRESVKKIKKEILDDVQEVDARVFFMPILESLSQRVLKEAVIQMKNDL